MSVVARLDAAQQRHSWLGLPIAVGYKFFDDQGGYLAALITYYGFLSLFPLLLLAITILGFVLVHDPTLRDQILTSALVDFPIVGRQVTDDIGGYRGSGVALVFGIVGSLYGGLGVAQAGQNAMNVVWAVPRNRRPNPLQSRVRSLRLLLVLGLGILVTTALSALSASAQSFAHDLNGVGVGLRILAFAVAVVANVGLFVLAFRLLTVKPVTVRDVWVGAVVAGLVWQLLEVLGTWVLGHEVKGATEVYGTFGFVLGLVFWIYIEALVVVFCAELNAVLRGGLWPRALLTPFTDDVDLTPADEQVYDAMASAQQAKGFEQIDVSFDPPGEASETESEDVT
jgi:membrane protein